MKVLKLLRLFLKKTYSFKYFIYRFKSDKKTKVLTFVLLLTIPSFITMGYLLVNMLTSLYDAFSMFNQTPFFLTLVFLIITFVILLFGFIQAITGLFFSKDVEMLVHLPIKPKHILLSKFTQMLVYEYIITGFFYIPTVVIFGINEGMNVFYYIISIIIFGLLPVFPLIIATLLSVIVNRLVGFSRKKELFTVVASLLLIGGIIFIQASLFNTFKPGEEDLLNQLVNDRMYLFEQITKYNIFINFSIKALIQANILYLLGFIALTLLSLQLFLELFKKMYFESLINQKGNRKSKKRVNKESIHSSKNKAIMVFKNDFKIISRTSPYILNILSIPILIPLIFAIYFISGIYDKDMLTMLPIDTLNYFNVGYIVFLLFFGAVTPTTSTTFSREGLSAWITQTLPIRPRDQIFGRLITSLIITSMFILTTLIPISYMIDNLSYHTIILGVVALISTFPVLIAGLTIDLMKPSLKWGSPTVAVKQNLNVFLSMFIGVIFIALYILLANIFNFGNVFLVAITIISLLISYGLYRLTCNMFSERLKTFNL